MKVKIALLAGIAALLWIAISVFSSGTNSRNGSEALSVSSPDTVGIKWYGYDEGMALGKKEGKKILLHFYADWCHYCKKMDSETFSKRDVADYMNRNFIPIRLNSDTETRLAQEYRVSGLPTTWFMDKDGERIQSLPGYLPREMFLAFLKYIHTDSYKTMSFQIFMNTQ